MTNRFAAVQAIAVKIFVSIAVLPIVGLLASFQLPISIELNTVLFSTLPLALLAAWIIGIAITHNNTFLIRAGFLAGTVLFTLLTLLTESQHLGLNSYSAFRIEDAAVSDVLVFFVSSLLTFRGFLGTFGSNDKVVAYRTRLWGLVLVAMGVFWSSLSLGNDQ